MLAQSRDSRLVTIGPLCKNSLWEFYKSLLSVLLIIAIVKIDISLLTDYFRFKQPKESIEYQTQAADY